MRNFRAVQTTKGAVAGNRRGLPVGLVRRHKATLAAEHSGVVHMTPGPGDSVVPAWSARLVTQDPASVHHHPATSTKAGGVPPSNT